MYGYLKPGGTVQKDSKGMFYYMMGDKDLRKLGFALYFK